MARTSQDSTPRSDSTAGPGGEPLAADQQRPERASADERTSADEQIRARAHEIYSDRGGTPGDELEDWLQAEREYRDQSRHRSTGDSDAGSDAGETESKPPQA